MLDLIDDILARLDGGERVALCLLVRARGSTPQASGAAMLVLANGQTRGTLGGGCVEAEVRRRAFDALLAADHVGTSDGVNAHLSTFKLDHDYGWDDGLMCGGMMDVSVQVLHTSDDAAPLRALRNELLAKRRATYVVTAIDETGVTQSFVVPFAPRPTLLIAGAGHVGQAIAELASRCDFDVAVIDDRADVASPARFPTVRRVVGPSEHELARWPIDAHTYVVIVTRGHRHDASALAAVIDSRAAYIGMIGSTRKVRTILDGLATAGVTRAQLYAVRAPIGLAIGAVTPHEIAVSVCAELIAVRRGHDQPTTSLQIPPEQLTRWLDRPTR